MVTELRRSADAEAQRAMHALVENIVRNPQQTKPDPLVADVYFAAERVRDAVGNLEHAIDVLTQRDDPEAPDWRGWQENELRAAWGNR